MDQGSSEGMLGSETTKAGNFDERTIPHMSKINVAQTELEQNNRSSLEQITMQLQSDRAPAQAPLVSDQFKEAYIW